MIIKFDIKMGHELISLTAYLKINKMFDSENYTVVKWNFWHSVPTDGSKISLIYLFLTVQWKILIVWVNYVCWNVNKINCDNIHVSWELKQFGNNVETVVNLKLIAFA